MELESVLTFMMGMIAGALVLCVWVFLAPPSFPDNDGEE